MPQIFDNIDNKLLESLSEAMRTSYRCDFCVGYFNLRGWRLIDSLIENWEGGENNCCRLLVGMQALPQDQIREFFRKQEPIDQAEAVRLKEKAAQDFHAQLVSGTPTNADEAGLRRLVKQLQEGKLIVKLFLRHPLHAKLYLLFREDQITGKF